MHAVFSASSKQMQCNICPTSCPYLAKHFNSGILISVAAAFSININNQNAIKQLGMLIVRTYCAELFYFSITD